jgi:ketosteroid isomerase-like protein
MAGFCTVPGVAPNVRGVLDRAVPQVRGALRRVVDSRRPKPSPPSAAEPKSHRDLLDRMEAALRVHDLDGVLETIHPDFHGEQPLHPASAATDREQLRRNWATIIANVPDVRAEVLDSAVEGDTIWSEWRIYGTRRDGRALDLRSVWICGVRDGKVAWGRLYREPIEADEGETGDTIDRLTRPL